jgi:hypothetical protein
MDHGRKGMNGSHLPSVHGMTVFFQKGRYSFTLSCTASSRWGRLFGTKDVPFSALPSCYDEFAPFAGCAGNAFETLPVSQRERYGFPKRRPSRADCKMFPPDCSSLCKKRSNTTFMTLPKNTNIFTANHILHHLPFPLPSTPYPRSSSSHFSLSTTLLAR